MIIINEYCVRCVHEMMHKYTNIFNLNVNMNGLVSLGVHDYRFDHLFSKWDISAPI